MGPAPTFTPTLYNSTFATPSTNWNVNPRIDYAISQNNTLVVRFQHNTRSRPRTGVGGFSLPTQEVINSAKQNTVQATETTVIGTKSVNEVLFQYDESVSDANAAFIQDQQLASPGPSLPAETMNIITPTTNSMNCRR